MDFSYENLKCNIKNCPNESKDLLLCDTHYKKYIIDSNVEGVQKIIFKSFYKSNTIKEKIKILLSNILHFSTLKHTFYVEHYPLESLFLYHFHKFLKDYHNYQNEEEPQVKEKLIQNGYNLIKDFNYNENHFTQEIKEILNILEDRLKFEIPEKVNNLLINYEITKILPKPDKFKLLLIILFITYILLKILKIQIITFFNLNLFSVILSLLVGLFWVQRGLLYIYSVDSLTQKAFNNNLYKEKFNNTEFLKQVNKLKSKLLKDGEFQVSALGCFSGHTAMLLVILIKNLYQNSTTLLSTILSLLFAGVLIFILRYFFLIYPVITSFTHFIPSIPKSNFKIDLYQPNKLSNVGEITNTVKNNLVFNLTFYLLLWSIPAIVIVKYSNIPIVIKVIVFIIISLISFLRTYNIRHSILILRAIIRNFVLLKNNELSLLESQNLKENIISYNFIKSLNLKIFSLPLFIKKNLLTFILFIISILISLQLDNKIELVDFVKQIILRLLDK